MEIPEDHMRCLSFSEEAPDTTVFFQVILLPGQCFVWIGSGRAKVTSLVAAAATPYDSVPSTTTLMTGEHASEEGSALARKLAVFLHMPVLCSSNLPQNSPLLQAFAERKLKDRLKTLMGS
ncbi:uncharacterized protein LOC142357757 [Convolutriloba macropyga]|uniref:uncharacterized protein LOC142357757 n=1 Tax=Convolutriloba macropyga TaxID=536237 RepID=UPI003F5213ED